jgi:hypothetical protein
VPSMPPPMYMWISCGSPTWLFNHPDRRCVCSLAYTGAAPDSAHQDSVHIATDPVYPASVVQRTEVTGTLA